MKSEIAIIGCGRIGSVHARAIIETLPMVDLVCADVEPHRAIDLADRVGAHAVDIGDIWDRPNLSSPSARARRPMWTTSALPPGRCRVFRNR